MPPPTTQSIARRSKRLCFLHAGHRYGVRFVRKRKRTGFASFWQCGHFVMGDFLCRTLYMPLPVGLLEYANHSSLGC